MVAFRETICAGLYDESGLGPSGIAQTSVFFLVKNLEFGQISAPEMTSGAAILNSLLTVLKSSIAKRASLFPKMILAKPSAWKFLVSHKVESGNVRSSNIAWKIIISPRDIRKKNSDGDLLLIVLNLNTVFHKY